MAGIFDGWVTGSDVGESSWDEFYAGIGIPWGFEVKNKDTKVDKFTFEDLAAQFGASAKKYGFGTSEVQEVLSDVAAESGSGGVGGEEGADTWVSGLLEGVGGMFARGAIIVLGFIFVAVGLSMFRDK